MSGESMRIGVGIDPSLVPSQGAVVPMGAGSGQAPPAPPAPAGGTVHPASGGVGGAGQGAGVPNLGGSQPIVPPAPPVAPTGTPANAASGGAGSGAGAGAVQPQQPVQPQVIPQPVTSGVNQSSNGGGSSGGGSTAAPSTPSVPQNIQIPYLDLAGDLDAYKRARAAGKSVFQGISAAMSPYATRYSRGTHALRDSGYIDDENKNLLNYQFEDTISGDLSLAQEGQHSLYAEQVRRNEKLHMARRAMGGAAALAGQATRGYYSDEIFSEERVASNLVTQAGAGMLMTGHLGVMAAGAVTMGVGTVLGARTAAKESGAGELIHTREMAERPGAQIAFAKGMEVGPNTGRIQAARAAHIMKGYGYQAGEAIYMQAQFSNAVGYEGSADATEYLASMANQGVGVGVLSNLAARVGASTGIGDRAAAQAAAMRSATDTAFGMGMTADRVAEYVGRRGAVLQGLQERGISAGADVSEGMDRFARGYESLGAGTPVGYGQHVAQAYGGAAHRASSMMDVGRGLAETAMMASAAVAGGDYFGMMKELERYQSDQGAADRAVRSSLGSGDTTRFALQSIMGQDAAKAISEAGGVPDVGAAPKRPDEIAKGVTVTLSADAETKFTAVFAALAANQKDIIDLIKDRNQGSERRISAVPGGDPSTGTNIFGISF